MKRAIIIIFLFVSLANAQKPDTLKSAGTESIDVRAMVQKQIENARNKKAEAVSVASLQLPENIKVPAITEKPVTANSNFIFSFFVNLPFHYQLFILMSFGIVGFVVVNRIIATINKAANKNLKNRIGMMREEKVGGAKANPKLQKSRKLLKDNLEIFKQSEKHLAKTARELNIAQGELLLAARLKFYEMKKM
jgi:hypothetical protein